MNGSQFIYLARAQIQHYFTTFSAIFIELRMLLTAVLGLHFDMKKRIHARVNLYHVFLSVMNKYYWKI